MPSGKALIFSAPSGSGKTTIVRHLLNTREDLQFSISATTRKPRVGEINGKDYYFLNNTDFEAKISNNELVEWEEVYPGIFYGTLKSELDRIWAEGDNVIFDVDVIGGSNLNRIMKEKSLGIFIKVPSLGDLEKRLLSRGTETHEDLKPRIEKAKEELRYEDQFDVTLINDTLTQTLEEAERIVNEFLDKKS